MPASAVPSRDRPASINRRAIPAVLLTSAVTVAGAAVPDLALAGPTLALDRTCYSEQDTMRMSGSGYTPGAEIALVYAANGVIGSLSTRADQAGAFATDVRAPELDDFESDADSLDFSVTANDQAKFGPDGTNIGPPEDSFAPGEFRVKRWFADVSAWNSSTARSRRGQRTRLRTGGWTSLGSTLYVHYMRAGRAVHSERIGALSGPCGDAARSFKAFTFRGARPGVYSIRFSTSPRWSRSDPWLGYRRVRLSA